jgi:biopolymer transport protein TolR
MAFSQNNGKHGLVSDINVTPLVDVMLVLLIIFMITAPMMTQGVDVNLPQTTARPLRQDEAPVIVTVTRKGEIFVDRTRGDQAMLREQLGALARRGGTNRTILLKADKNVSYGLVVAVMADIKGAGFDKLGMVTEPRSEGR